MKLKCWCGSNDFKDFNREYSLCLACNTLVWKEKERFSSQTTYLEENNYYGSRYWLEHQHDLGLPDIYTRMDLDWIDRIPYWIKKITKYKLPPASTIEIGCSHGGLVAGMRWVGYDSIGIELSPEIIELAQKTYGVPVLLGPIEEQNLPPNSIDMVIMMDVLEHLPYPENTLSTCSRLLKPDGVLVIQTPRFPEKDFKTLYSSQHPFLKMLIPQEHLFLFSVSSIKELLHRVGFRYLSFEPSLFPYDMFLFASHHPLTIQPLEDIERIYQASNAARMVKIIQVLSQTFQETSMKLSHIEHEFHELRQQNQKYQSLINTLRSSKTYLFTRKLGRFAWIDTKFHQLQERKLKPSLPPKSLNPSDYHLKVAIDLTPVLPGGVNGGAKLLALNLIKFWSRELAPHWEYILLTSDISHDELAWLDSTNVQRVCVNFTIKDSQTPSRSISARLKNNLSVQLKRLLGSYRIQRLFSLYHKFILRPQAKNIIEDLNVDVVFCPFTAPFYYSPKIPIILVVHDLQFLYYPQFFTPEEIFHTNRYFQQSTQVATKLICISEYTRKTVLENSLIDPCRVVTIHNNILNPLPTLSPEEEEQITKKIGLNGVEYLFYPANFWQHKNHTLLLIAFNVYCRRNPQTKLHLVFSGAPSTRMTLLQEATKRMGIEHRVHFLGYLDDKEFSATLKSCKALIFPSLFEGFGVPILEAMSHGKPVFCSNVTSIPEVVSDAAFTFDPHQVEEIVSAIEQADNNPSLLFSLSKKGYERASQWITPKEWANAYLQVILQAIAERRE